MKTISIGGKTLEDTEALEERLGISRMTLWRFVVRGLPQSVKLGKHQYYDPEAVDAWLLSQTGTR